MKKSILLVFITLFLVSCGGKKKEDTTDAQVPDKLDKYSLIMESICPKCFEVYNKAERSLIILPCGDGICLECFDESLNPLDSKISCPLDSESVFVNNKFKENVKIIRRSF